MFKLRKHKIRGDAFSKSLNHIDMKMADELSNLFHKTVQEDCQLLGRDKLCLKHVIVSVRIIDILSKLD